MLFPSGDPVQRLHDVSGSRSCEEDLPAFPRMFLSAAVRSTSPHCVGIFVLGISMSCAVIIGERVSDLACTKSFTFGLAVQHFSVYGTICSVVAFINL